MGGKSKKSVTVGYRYYLGLHFGICHGPVDSLERIDVAERTVYSSPVSGNSQIYIDAPNVFGGESREGGIQGAADVMFGGIGQGFNDYLAAKQGVPQPNYRGILGLVFRGGLIACNNPYVKPWSFRVKRILAGWHGGVWYSSRATINVGGISAANPAHIIYECLTNPTWGMGYPSTLIDNSSFEAAANTFYNEGLGLCIAWGQQDSLNNFVQVVLDHAGAVLSQDAGGGFFKLKALRADYSIGALTTFSDSNGRILSLEKIERATYTENVNEIIVQFIDAATGRQSSIYVQNLANVQAQGAVVSQTRQYLGIPSAALATRIGMRDIKASTSGLARVIFVANRSAFSFVPGDVISFSWAPSGIVSMPLRITKIDYGPLTSGLIRIEALEDVFGLPATTYAGVPPIGWTAPNYTPAAASSSLAMEASYKDLYDFFGPADIANIDQDAGYLIAAASRPSSGVSTNYRLQTRAGSASFVDKFTGDWAPTGLLADGISRTATSITLLESFDLDSIEINSLGLIGSGVSGEIVQITAIDLATNTLTIRRGCVDTVPGIWPSGTRFTEYDTHGVNDEVEYVSGENVAARFITRTSTGELSEAASPISTVQMNRRQFRPYPPGRFRFNGLAYPNRATDSVEITWVPRNRVTQADVITDEAASGVALEANSSYRLRITNTVNNTVVDDITTTSTTFTKSGDGIYKVELWTVRDSLSSWQTNSHLIVINPEFITSELNETLAQTTCSAVVFTPTEGAVTTTTQNATANVSVVITGLDWTPSQNLAALDLWLDAAATASVTLSGSEVTQWADLSGNNRHALPVAGFGRPEYLANGINGRPGLKSVYAGVTDALMSTGAVNKDFAFFIVFRNDSGGSGHLFDLRNSADSNIVVDDLFEGGGGLRLRGSNYFQTVSYALGRTSTPQVAAYHFLDLNSAVAYLGGRLRGGTTVEINNGGNHSGINNLGFPGRTVATYVTISEVIIVKGVWTPDQRERFEGYLAWKWGITLPAGHRFQSAPPPAPPALSWTPSQLASVRGWWDADDASTTTLSGASVTQWRDKSGNGIHADSAGSAPQILNFGQGQRRVIHFNGNQFLRIAFGATGSNTSFARALFQNKTTGSIIAAVRAIPADGGSAQSRSVFHASRVNAGDGNARFQLDWSLPGPNRPSMVSRRQDSDASDALLATPTNQGANFAIVHGQINWGAASAAMYVNGSLTPTASSSTYGTAGSTSNTASQAVTIGGFQNTDTGARGMFNGYIAEIIISDQIWSDAERQQLEGYLAWKWGYAAMLPTAHPYKNAPP